MNIVYLHGLSSSGQSNTANKLRALFPDDNIIAPDLPVNPNEAMLLIRDTLQKMSIDNTIVIGSSMGAMFAHQQTSYCRILINPAFHVSRLLMEHIGKSLPFLSPRLDGIREFSVTEELCSLYEQMESRQFDFERSDYNHHATKYVIGLFGLQDNIVNCKDEFINNFDIPDYAFYHEYNGGHRLTDTEIENVLKPAIDWIKNPNLAYLRPIVFKNTRKKYELTEETITLFKDYMLYRIKALRDFGDIKAGDLGGYIEKESNLSHNGDAWLYEDAMVYGDAQVYGNALVYGEAEVYGEARIYGEAEVYGNAYVSGNANVFGNAHVYGDAHVCGDVTVHGNAHVCDNAEVDEIAQVCGEAMVYGNALVRGNALVFGNAEVYGNAAIGGNVRVDGNAKVYGNAVIGGNEWVDGDARIQSSDDLCTFGYFGSSNFHTTAFKIEGGGIGVKNRCFQGTFDEFRNKVKEPHDINDYAVEYLMIADLIEHKLSRKAKK